MSQIADIPAVTSMKNLINLVVDHFKNNRINIHVFLLCLDAASYPHDIPQYLKLLGMHHSQHAPAISALLGEIHNELSFLKTLPKGLEEFIQSHISESLCAYSSDYSGRGVQTIIHNKYHALDCNHLEDFTAYIIDKKMFKCFELQEGNNGIFTSTAIHIALNRGFDGLAMQMASYVQNKSILFARDSDGRSTYDIAVQNNCIKYIKFFDENVSSSAQQARSA